MTNFLEKVRSLSWTKRILIVLALLIVLFLVYRMLHHTAPVSTAITVERGTITETVSVTGNTTPTNTVSLAFQNGGTISSVNYKLGDRVAAGATIASINTASLSAALQQAQAEYDSAVASRSSTSLPETEVQARNAYVSAYTTLDNVLQNDADLLFGGPTPYGPELTISAPMYNFGELSKERSTLSTEMDTYQSTLSQAQTGDPLTLLSKATTVANEVAAFLNKLSTAAHDTQSGATHDQLTALASGRASIDTLLSTLSSARDSYRTGSTGATSLADASVKQAAAKVAAAKANFQGTQIVAPISGTITQQDAKVGQSATPGTPLVSIISSSGFEVDAGVSETDIGKLAIGDKASMTLDAFPNETFAGTVFYIAPAETNTSGVISYAIKIAFDNHDPRLKSGLTANIDIQAQQKKDVLILPQYAILQNDSGTFVQTLVNGKATTTPVTLGIHDQKGNVEVVSGVTEGQTVQNVGLKTQ